MPTEAASIESMRNLGPACAVMLRAAGITTPDQLRAAGAVDAYMRARYAVGRRSASLNLLYALWGALEDVRWDEVPEDVKGRLREAAGVEPAGRRRRG
jgi:DNA transformation protein and related proteins